MKKFIYFLPNPLLFLIELNITNKNKSIITVTNAIATFSISLFFLSIIVIISLLLENKIYCRKYYKPLTDTPISVDFYNKIVCVSCTIDMNKNDIDKILAVIKQI